MTEEERRDHKREVRIQHVLRQRPRDLRIPPFTAVETRLRRHTPLPVVVAMSAATLVLALVIGSAVAERRAATPAATTPPAQPQPLAVRAPAVDPDGYDLVYVETTTVGGEAPAGYHETTIRRLDPKTGASTELAGFRSPAELNVFAAISGEVLVVAWDRSWLLRSNTRLEGAAMDVRSVHSWRGRLVATTLTRTVDLTDFPRVREIAQVGGEVIGELEDGRLLIARHDSDAMVLTLIAVDDRGSAQIVQVQGALGKVAAPAGAVVLVHRLLTALERTDPGETAVVRLEISTGSERGVQGVGPDLRFSFAARHTQESYVFLDPKAFFSGGELAGTVQVGERIGSAVIYRFEDALTKGRMPQFDARRSWSPDDAFLAFPTLAEFRGPNFGSLQPRRQGLAVYTGDAVRSFEIEPIEGVVYRIAGWIAR